MSALTAPGLTSVTKMAACAAAFIVVALFALPAKAERHAGAAPAAPLVVVGGWAGYEGVHSRNHRKRGHWHQRRHHRRPPGFFGGHHRAKPRHHAPVARACHPVTLVHFRHGHKVLVGHILCYDRRGRAFLLRGSGRIMRYGFR